MIAIGVSSNVFLVKILWPKKQTTTTKISESSFCEMKSIETAIKIRSTKIAMNIRNLHGPFDSSIIYVKKKKKKLILDT